MDELKKRLSDLKITISSDGEGEITVFTTSEPLFCFVCGTPEEAVSLVEDTLRSYAQKFYGIEEVAIDFHHEPVIPIKELTPIEYVRPVFATRSDNSELALA